MRRFLIGSAVVLATLGIAAGVWWAGQYADAGDTLWPVAWVAWAPVGALILLKRPRNGVGITMLLIGLFWGIGFLFTGLALSPVPFEMRVWAEILGVLFGAPPWLGVVWLLLVFPSGRLLGRLERFTALGLLAVGLLAVVGFAVSSDPMEVTGVPSPLEHPEIETVTSFVVEESGFLLVLALVLSALVSLIRRWRVSSGIERHQYRWLSLGAVVFATVISIGQFVPDDVDAPILWLVAGWAVPVVVGVAVTRYRLFEIDRIISRTVSYALVVGLLGLLVAGVAAVAGAQFQEPWVVAATTLGVAASFSPVRKRVQAAVDRRFNRSRYDAERVTDQFAGSLRDRVDSERLLDDWLVVVAETMRPAAAGVWIREGIH